MDKIDVSIKKLEAPPKSREETEIIRNAGRVAEILNPIKARNLVINKM